MKTSFLCLGIIATCFIAKPLAGVAQTNEWGPITNDVRMALIFKGKQASIKTNQPFSVLIRVNNLSTNRPYVWGQALVNRPDTAGIFSVISPSGKDVSPTIPKVYLRGSMVSIRVTPGETRDQEFNLGAFCKFEEIGTYKITLKRYIGNPTNHGWMFANTINLSVVPGTWKPDKTNNPALDGF